MTRACCLFITRAHEYGAHPTTVGHFGQSLIDRPLVDEYGDAFVLSEARSTGLMLVQFRVDEDTRGCRRGLHTGMVTTISQIGGQLHLTLVTHDGIRHYDIPLKLLSAFYLKAHRDFVIRDGILVKDVPVTEEDPPA